MMEKSKVSLFALVVLSVVGLVFLMTNWANAAAPAGTISYWKLDETPAPLEYVDSVGTNDGEPGATAPVPNPIGIVGGAQQFDGADTQINVPDPGDGSFDFGVNDSFTIECWMNSTKNFDDAGDINQVIVGRDDLVASNMQWWLGMEGFAGANAGNVIFYVQDNSSNWQMLNPTNPAPVPINNGIWHHLVGIYNGTDDSVSLYVDKVKVAEVTPTGLAGGFTAAGADLNLGWLDLAPGFSYEGTLDEVAFYSRVLTPDEIKDHYDNGLAGHGVDYVAPTPTPKSGGGGGGGGCFIGTIAE